MRKSAQFTEVAVEAAISDVLTSRRNALDAVAHAAGDAERVADEARKTSRRIAERADRRIRKLRLAFDAAIRAKIAVIDAEAAAQDAAHELTPSDMTQLAHAVEALCDELTRIGYAPRRQP